MSDTNHVTQAQDFVFEHTQIPLKNIIIRNANHSIKCLMFFSITLENNIKSKHFQRCSQMFLWGTHSRIHWRESHLHGLEPVSQSPDLTSELTLPLTPLLWIHPVTENTTTHLHFTYTVERCLMNVQSGQSLNISRGACT